MPIRPNTVLLKSSPGARGCQRPLNQPHHAWPKGLISRNEEYVPSFHISAVPLTPFKEIHPGQSTEPLGPRVSNMEDEIPSLATLLDMDSENTPPPVLPLTDHHDIPFGLSGDPEVEDDIASVISSYAASIFSVQSLASSATGLSKGSGYSAKQIATATKELVAIFQGDEVLVPLYMSAVEDPSIGPERLERNLRRLFKKYAEHLKVEAKDQLEYLAARLVSLKARFLAQSIVEWFDSGSPSSSKGRREVKDESSEEDEDEARPFDDTAFEDLDIFREFLVGSDAFQTLRTQLRVFVLPVPLQSALPDENVREQDVGGVCSKVECSEMLRSRSAPALSGWLKHALNAFFIATGQLEHPLESGKVRLKWQCVSTLRIPS